MNKTNLIGRITKDPELRYNSGDVAYVRFTLAVNRSFLNANGEREADFISCVAWRKTAELITEHFKKGSEFGVSGRIQTGSYDNTKGDKVFTTDVIVEEITFVGSKKEGRPEPEYTGQPEPQAEKDPFAEFGNEVVLNEEDLPF
jgi:single-strand DNA-binding protein